MALLTCVAPIHHNELEPRLSVSWNKKTHILTSGNSKKKISKAKQLQNKPLPRNLNKTNKQNKRWKSDEKPLHYEKRSFDVLATLQPHKNEIKKYENIRIQPDIPIYISLGEIAE